MPRRRPSRRRSIGSSSQGTSEKLQNEDYDATTLAAFHSHFQDPIQLPKDNQEQIIGHPFEKNFDCGTIQQANTNIYDVTGNSVFMGRNISALAGSSSQARHFFSSFEKYGSHVFEPLVGYQHQQNFLVFGGYLGNTQSWIDKFYVGNNKKDFWVNSNTLLGPRVKDMGIQVMTFLTTLHQQNRFVGNLRESLCIHPESNKVTFATISQNTDVVSGIQNDLSDFLAFLEDIKPKNIPDPPCYLLFKDLFPVNHYPINIEELKELSFIICHSPLFWRSHERYIFIEKVYQWARHVGYATFDNDVKFVNKKTNVAGWQLKLPLNDPLELVFKFNGNNVNVYNSDGRIVFYLRNCFAHYQKHDPTTTIENVDERLLNIFLDAYDKIYYELFLLFQNSGMVHFLKGRFAPECSLNYAERS